MVNQLLLEIQNKFKELQLSLGKLADQLVCFRAEISVVGCKSAYHRR